MSRPRASDTGLRARYEIATNASHPAATPSRHLACPTRTTLWRALSPLRFQLGWAPIRLKVTGLPAPLPPQSSQIFFGLAMRATRVIGAISLSIVSHFPAMLASIPRKPVRLPPGRLKLATNPAPTGSATPTNTTGIARLSRCNEATTCGVCAKITSGLRATSS